MDTIRHLESLRRREHEATVELIRALITCAENEDHVAAGYASIWALLVERLKYSPAAASRRNATVKIARENPDALVMLAEHRTSLTGLAKIAHLLRAEDFEAVLRAIDGASAEDVERVLAARRPQPRTRERVKRTVVRIGASDSKSQPKSQPPTLELAQSSDSKLNTSLDSPPAPNEERVVLTFSVSADDYAGFERARAKASRKHGPGVSIETTFREMLASYEDRVPAKPRPTKAPTRRHRHVPATVRRAVFERDGQRCTFLGPDGHRCTATRDLQIDHVEPYAAGGQHEESNLRVLCGKHNRWRSGVRPR